MSDGDTPMVRVVIADDQALMRTGFSMIVDAAPDMEVVGEAADGVEAVSQVDSLRPDVVLMDIRMPRMSGIEATRRIAAQADLADVHILVLTTFDADEYVYDALRAGASGFLLKDTDPPDLLDAIRVVATGEALLAPSITRRLIEHVVSTTVRSAVDDSALDQLTPREREVVSLAARGLSNAEIAETLYISVTTAKTHVSRSMLKLQARDRAQLVTIAYEAGLVIPGQA